MTVKHLGDSYDFESENREERYGGDINFYIQWERHLMYACPSAYRAPLDMKFREFLNQHFTDEEEILARADFPRLADHLDSHRDALDKYDALFSECGEACTKSGNSQCMENLSYLLFDHFLRGEIGRAHV